MKKSWTVGVDLGGTWVRVAARASGGTALKSLKAPAPPLDKLLAFLDHLWRRWGWGRSSVRGVVVSSRGVWTKAERRRLERRLKKLALRVRVISDVEAAYLGALGERAGVVVIAGTGSIALARDNRGRWRRSGGLGPLLGDEGSAFWIGREWLRAAERGGEFARARKLSGSPDAVARIAALAPEVLRKASRGNRVPRSIVREAQSQLATLALRAVRQLGIEEPVMVSWGGTLLSNPEFRRGFVGALRRSGLRVRLVKPRESPAHAASSLASTLLR